MRILSIDVGLLNLAYCVIELIDKDTKKFNVVDWGIINVSQDVEECCICGKPGKFKGYDSVYCGIHKGKHVKRFNLNKDVDKVFEEQCCVCEKKAKFCIKNENYCTPHKNSTIKRLEKEDELRPIKKENIMKTGVNELCERMGRKLDEKNFKDIDKVVIENQPVIKNPKMKTVQIFVSSYFILRLNIDRDLQTEVVFCLASNKLKYDIEKTKKVLSTAKNSQQKYDLTKSLGEEYALEVLKNNDQKKWLTFLEDNKKKKDDLCDSLMQGYYCMFIK